MDLAYDHLQEEIYAKKEESNDGSKPEQSHASLNDDFQDAYKAFSNSPWGAKLGGFFGNVVKQGSEVVTQAQKELAEVGEDATKGFSSLRTTIISHTRNLSLNTAVAGPSSQEEEGQTTPTKARGAGGESEQSETVISRLRAEAAKRLKDIQKAEDAADEALLRFGSNVRDYLRDAVSIAPPQGNDQSGTVLFESKDAQGKRVIHASRFDAQLHVIHTSTESFAKDPTGAEFEKWGKTFDVDKKTPDINTDLQKYPDLKTTMEKLVPDQIPYADFWKRYYFLRHGIETAEARRRDLLQAASAEDDVAWDDDDSDDDSDSDESTKTEPAKKIEPTKTEPTKTEPAKTEAAKAVPTKTAPTKSTPTKSIPTKATPTKTEPVKTVPAKTTSAASSTTIHPASDNLKPAEPRKSNDGQSQADSEASYDVVGATSGKTTQTLNSPKSSKKDEDSDDDSDEDSDEEDDDDDSDEDWE